MTTPKQRNRGIRLSTEGINIVRVARGSRNLSLDQLGMRMYASISTVKRFASGQNIEKNTFYEACRILNLNPDELIALPNSQQNSAAPLAPAPPQRSPIPHSGTSPQSFMITGTFSPNKLAEIEIALAHLEELLRDTATFTLVPEGNYLAVSGTFSEDKKPQVEVTLLHISKLLLEHNITYM